MGTMSGVRHPNDLSPPAQPVAKPWIVAHISKEDWLELPVSENDQQIMNNAFVVAREPQRPIPKEEWVKRFFGD